MPVTNAARGSGRGLRREDLQGRAERVADAGGVRGRQAGRHGHPVAVHEGQERSEPGDPSTTPSSLAVSVIAETAPARLGGAADTTASPVRVIARPMPEADEHERQAEPHERAVRGRRDCGQPDGGQGEAECDRPAAAEPAHGGRDDGHDHDRGERRRQFGQPARSGL
ncbi:hypothetical protein GCM10020218_065310 [Dactylosporangium vinaceum]